MNYYYYMLVAALLGGAGGVARAESELPELAYRSNAVYSIPEAAAAGNADVLRARIGEGCSTNQRDEAGNTPLHLAAAGGHAQCVRLLLQHGADPVATDAQGKMPAQCATDKASRRLCERGVQARRLEIELCDRAAAGDADTLREAMKRKGFNVNMLSRDNEHNLLMQACRSGNAEVVQLVLRHKPDLSRKGPGSRSVLHLAADTNRGEIVRLILAAGADPMAPAGNQATALHDAVWSCNHESVKALLPAYKECNFSPFGGRNGYPLGLAIARNNTPAVLAFVEAGFNPNDERYKDDPPLHFAARKDNADMVRALLKAGADKNARDKSGKTAREYAGAATAPLL